MIVKILTEELLKLDMKKDLCTGGQDLANPNTKRKGFISDISIKNQVFFSFMLPAVSLRITAKLFVDLFFFIQMMLQTFEEAYKKRNNFFFSLCKETGM